MVLYQTDVCFPPDIGDPRVNISCRDSVRSIGGGIIEDEDLQILVRLREHALQTLADVGFVIVGDDQNCDQRLHPDGITAGQLTNGAADSTM